MPVAGRCSVTVGIVVLTLAAVEGLAADAVLVPIVAGVHGQKDASWETEVRITNRTDAPKRFNIVDWIGTPGWKATAYVVAPHSTTSLGGAQVFGAFVRSPGVAGLAICEADTGLVVRSAVLAGIWTGGGGAQDGCSSFDGGGVESPCFGLPGAGPIIEGLVFTSTGQDVEIPWLHSAFDRRTNLVLINPDDSGAVITVSIVSQDGSSTQSMSYEVAGRSYNQINDLFSQEPWSAIRTANAGIQTSFGGGAAASATITSDKRLLAMAYVISDHNNSLTISLPR